MLFLGSEKLFFWLGRCCVPDFPLAIYIRKESVTFTEVEISTKKDIEILTVMC